MKHMKIQTITLVLCILCAICITPVMASTRTEIIEDGVHLLKSDDASTVLNPQIYRRFIDEEFVVDGDASYWVRIGNVKAATLSTNQLALLACKGTLMIGTGVASGLIVYVAGTGEVATAGTGSPWILPALFGAISGVMTFHADTVTGLCPIIEKWFVNNNFHVVASDGTILIGIQKDNTIGIQELKKQGIDINKLTHLSKDGVIIKQKLDL